MLLRHETRVTRVLVLLGLGAAEREDAAQEVFLRVFRHLASYRPGLPFGAWLYRIAVNVARDFQRQRRRRSSESAWNPAAELLPDRSPGPAALAHQDEDRRRLEAALARLSPRERIAFVLCDLEELETADVAQALGISAITVRRHLSRARDHLHRLLTGND
ncbi:MAG TPA: RNA polymerase sigma factor [Candidatus Polarisedimenticolaceae bacterium]|nr:RNA polymerase sigma factor [Candidatus Polarisedimenticolaceae bacterium]